MVSVTSLVFVGLMMMISALIPFLYKLVIEKFYPIIFVMIRNTGGGHNTKQVTLHPKIFLRGKWVESEYGQRMKIKGIKNTYPPQIFSQDKAIPWRGGQAYIIYEKELRQFFPTEIRFIMDKKSRDVSDKLTRIYEKLTSQLPDLREYFHLVTPQQALSNVGFQNDGFEIKPFPLDSMTAFTYDVRARAQRVTKMSKFNQYAPFVGLALIVIMFIIGMVLYFDFVKESLLVQGTTINENTNVLRSLAEKIGGEGVSKAPGGSIFIPLIPYFLRKGGKYRVGS